jgi:UPF0176 protein
MEEGGTQRSEVLLFYRYVRVQDPTALADAIRSLCESRGLLGRILVAGEGVNGTLEGPTSDTSAFEEWLRTDPRFTTMSFKRSESGAAPAFRKLSVKVRDEIVGTHFDASIDPAKQTGKRLHAEELRGWYESGKEFTILDMRNGYEYESGRFRDSINPGLGNSRDLPQALPRLEPYKDSTVLTVCTGGVRCEKMSAYLLEQGFKDVYQLEDGMHGYMQKYPGQDFEGALYTFDERVTMHFGGDREIVGRCRLCGAPTERYVNCANDECHLHFLVCGPCAGEGSPACSEGCRTVLRQSMIPS